MTTTDLIETIRADVKRELRIEILAELKPEIERMLYANIFEIKAAALYLKISVSTLRRMVTSKEIQHFRQRGQIYFRQSDLDRHIAQLINEGR